MLELLNRFWREEEGQDMVEYALIIALVAVVIVASLKSVGTTIESVFKNIESKLRN
ncbi:MAG: Flp family type IVb pilin [Acidobacteria bacterium]|nr:Flp family type IVb pilin [Acidobacteriota bacterium]MBI3657958.1 Flp family type IVb pilin [Acidobacteriota bacterium]